MFSARTANQICQARLFLQPIRDITTVIMGPPGGGKGTISKKLIKDFGYHHVSTGDMLRAHIKKSSPLGVKAKTFMDQGELVPDSLMVDLVLEEVKLVGAGKHLLLDGFPRTLTQATSLEKALKIDIALNLTVPNEEIVTRISGRWTHVASGRVYAYDYNPPKVTGKDDETGEALIQRDDDTPQSVRKRLHAYDKMTSPLIGHYTKQNVLKSFDGSDQPALLAQNKRSDAIYLSLKPHLERMHTMIR